MNEVNRDKFVAINQSSKKELDIIERNINKIIEYVNMANIDKSKENIVRLFITAYRNLCSERNEVADSVTVPQLLVLLSNAIREDMYINGSEYALVYANRKIAIKENIRFIACRYAEERGLSLFKEAFTKKAIEYITENNMKMPIQMSELPASIATERVTTANLHGINISFVRTENNEIERARYYTVEALCATARKCIKDGILLELNGNKVTSAWGEHAIEMFKKTALRNIMKDAIFF